MSPRQGDALIVVDLQNDFVSGALAVPRGGETVVPLNRAVDVFARRGLPVVATRDWHPVDHCSFREQGGPWPRHCVAGTPGADLVADLRLPADTLHVRKAATRERDAYSGFEGTRLDDVLRRQGVTRVFVGGLATDYCVLNTVRDARRLGYEVVVIADACRAVEVTPGDAARAEAEMQKAGAVTISTADLAPAG